jgi:hypothetical protein
MYAYSVDIDEFLFLFFSRTQCYISFVRCWNYYVVRAVALFICHFRSNVSLVLYLPSSVSRSLQYTRQLDTYYNLP